MTLENAKVLYNEFLELKDKVHADQLIARYPELAKEAPKEKTGKDNGKKSKR